MRKAPLPLVGRDKGWGLEGREATRGANQIKTEVKFSPLKLRQLCLHLAQIISTGLVSGNIHQIMLKGWLDRVWTPGVAFNISTEGGVITSNLRHIKRLGVITMCGAPMWWSYVVGHPGKRTILRGVRQLINFKAKSFFQIGRASCRERVLMPV